MKGAVARNQYYKPGDIINAECGVKRLALDVESTWKAMGSSKTGGKIKRHVVQSTKIKRASCMKALRLDYIYPLSHMM